MPCIFGKSTRWTARSDLPSPSKSRTTTFAPSLGKSVSSIKKFANGDACAASIWPDAINAPFNTNTRGPPPGPPAERKVRFAVAVEIGDCGEHASLKSLLIHDLIGDDLSRRSVGHPHAGESVRPRHFDPIGLTNADDTAAEVETEVGLLKPVVDAHSPPYCCIQ